MIYKFNVDLFYCIYLILYECLLNYSVDKKAKAKTKPKKNKHFIICFL